jgi:hypothetical protein
MSLILGGFRLNKNMFCFYRGTDWWERVHAAVAFKESREVLAVKTLWKYASALPSPMDFFYQESSPLLSDHLWTTALCHLVHSVNDPDMAETGVSMREHVIPVFPNVEESDEDVEMDENFDLTLI